MREVKEVPLVLCDIVPFPLDVENEVFDCWTAEETNHNKSIDQIINVLTW